MSSKSAEIRMQAPVSLELFQAIRGPDVVRRNLSKTQGIGSWAPVGGKGEGFFVAIPKEGFVDRDTAGV